MTNRYTRALRQIKDKTLDEKLELLSEIPTNNASGLYTDIPGHNVTPDPVQLLPRSADLAQDGDGADGYEGDDTTGLFLDDGTILIEEPPGDRSYVLGPMISMWYAWANYTQIGYVRQSDRKMVNLGRITGEMSDWNEVDGFTSYGQLTLEQAVWYKNQSRTDYRAFYPGPPSNPADTYGRYIGSIVDVFKPTERQDPTFWKPGTQRGSDPTDDLSLAMDNLGGLLAAAMALGFVFKSISDFINWFRQQSPEMQKKLLDLLDRDKEIAQGYPPGGPNPYGTPGADDPFDNDYYKGPPPDLDDDSDFPDLFPELDLAKGKGKRKGKGGRRRTQVAHHEPKGKLLSEDRTRILRDIKKPVQVKEIPTKFKVSPKLRNKNKSVGVDMMKIPDTPAQYKPQSNIWQKKDYAANVRASQEKKNEVLELLGAAEHHWTYLTEDRRRKHQEEVNEMAAAEYDKQMELLYEKHKIKENKLNKAISSVKKKNNDLAPEGAPPPPKPAAVGPDGYHTKYGKHYKYDKLDPHSAESMPPTGDPEIDANIKKATNAKEKARKLKILQGKKKTFNEFKDLNEQSWDPIAGGGPTNSASQTFEYGAGGPQFTANGLGGQDVYPQTIDFLGDQIPTPSYSDVALQGYTQPLSKEVMKRNKDAEEFRKKQDENLQKIKDTLESLGTSWEEMRANNWAIVKPDGTSIMLEPITPGNKQLNWIDNSKITVGKKHRNAGPNQNPFKVRNPDGSITIEFSEIKSVKKFEIGERPSVNAQLDASQDYTVEIDADAFMGGRVDGESPDTPTFADTGPDAPSPFRGHGSQYGPLPSHAPFTPSTNSNVTVTPEDEAFIDYMERYPNFVNSLFPGQAAAATSVINYARGNYSDITQSPGRSANQTILNIISRIHKPGQRGGSVTQGQNLGGPPSNINTAYPGGVNAILDAPMRNFLNQFNYEVTSDGVRIIDTFNFNGNRNTGALGNIPIKGPDGRMVSIQDVASRLAEIGDKRARSMGLNPSDDSLGAKIDFTIPWSQVPARIQNKLDPTATIIPTTKRGRRRRKGVQESTWNKLKKNRGS